MTNLKRSMTLVSDVIFVEFYKEVPSEYGTQHILTCYKKFSRWIGIPSEKTWARAHKWAADKTEEIRNNTSDTVEIIQEIKIIN